MTSTTSTEATPIPGRPIPAELLVPNSGQVQIRTAKFDDPKMWLEYALRGLDLPLRGDRPFIDYGLSDLRDESIARLAVLVERARQAERDSVLRELTPDVAAAELAERARAEGHAAGRDEAAREGRQALAEHEEKVAAARRRQAWLWSELTASIGPFEG